MALIKDHQMTENNRSARQRNGRHSRGAATAAGKERSRAANLKHGYYSQLRDEALVALGEDPAALAALIAGAHEQFEPTNDLQAAMAEHLARLHWRMLRAERRQESAMVSHIQKVEEQRRRDIQQFRYSYGDTQAFLGLLRRGVGRPDFYAVPLFFGQCRVAMKRDSGPGMEKILDLLYRLRDPQRFSEPAPPPLPEAMDDAEWDAVPDLPDESDEAEAPPPEIAVAEGEERDELRQELRYLADEEIRLNSETWEKAITEHEAPLSILDRDRLAGDVAKQNALMRQEESSCCREFWRIANVLMKFQDRKDKGKSEVRGPMPEAEQGSDVRSPRSEDEKGAESKQESEGRGPKSEAENVADEQPDNFASLGPDSASPVELPTSTSAVPTPDFGHRTPDAFPLTPSTKNEGASGDIHEKKGSGKKNVEVRPKVTDALNASGFLRQTEMSGKKARSEASV